MGLSVKLCIEYTVWVCTMVTDNKCAKKVLFLEFQVLYNAIGYHIYIQMYRDMILHSYCSKYQFLTYLNIHYISWFSDPTKGFHIDDACVDSCSSVIEHSFCNQTTHTCQCKPSHNIIVEGGIDCVSGEYLKLALMYSVTNSDMKSYNFISW